MPDQRCQRRVASKVYTSKCMTKWNCHQTECRKMSRSVIKRGQQVFASIKAKVLYGLYISCISHLTTRFSVLNLRWWNWDLSSPSELMELGSQFSISDDGIGISVLHQNWWTGFSVFNLRWWNWDLSSPSELGSQFSIRNWVLNSPAELIELCSQFSISDDGIGLHSSAFWN